MRHDTPGESWRDLALLLDMVLAAEHALSVISGIDEAKFLASDLRQGAVIPKLEVVGKSACKVSGAFLTGAPGHPWREITGCATVSSVTIRLDISVACDEGTVAEPHRRALPPNFSGS